MYKTSGYEKELFHFNRPIIEITLTTRQGQKIYLENAEFGGDVLSFSFEKDVTKPFGKFNFTLLDKRGLRSSDIEKKGFSKYVDLRKAIKAKTLVEVKINGDYITIGTVESVKRTMSISGGKPERRYEVSCEELGNIFKNTKLNKGKKNPNENGNKKNPKTKASNIKTKKIQNVIKTIWNQFVEKIYDEIKFKFADDEALTEKIVVDTRYFANQMWTDDVLYNFQSGDGTEVWDAFHQLTTPYFHEMWGTTGASWKRVALTDDKIIQENDLTDGRYYLMLRPTPYDNPNIMNLDGSLLSVDNLTKIFIDDSVLVSKDLGTSGENMYSMYSIVPESNGSFIAKKNYNHEPEYDYEALNNYGYMALEKTIKSSKTAKTESQRRQQAGNLAQLAGTLQRKAAEWYRFSDQMLSGSFTCMGNTRAQEGAILVYDEDARGSIEDVEEKGIYYIQSFSHNYQYGQSFTTTYNVVRGTPEYLSQEIREMRDNANSSASFY